MAPTSSLDKCPLCQHPESMASHAPTRDASQVTCPRCGKYLISGSALAVLKSVNPADLPMLSAHTRQQNVFHRNEPMLLTPFQEIIRFHRSTSIQRRADNLLRYVATLSSGPGDYVSLNSTTDFPIVDGHDQGALLFYIDYWHNSGHLECIAKTMDGTCDCRLTVRGWERIGSLRPTPERVFIAMSFDPSLDCAFEQGIRPAIEQDCGMTCIRVDRLHFSEKICDRIMAEIQNCDILFADFTHHKNGVYFEAGYGLALGKLVIWSCRRDEINKAHFDTRQYPHIVWESPSDLRERLRDRITVLTGQRALSRL